MNKKFGLAFLLFLMSWSSFSSVIEGQNKAYAGKELTFYTYSDPVTMDEKPLFSLKFDNEGKFRTEVTVQKTTFVFCDFGVYRGQFFLEPGKTTDLLFPPLREKSFADSKNPFFEPVIFWFAIQNDKGLNKKISDFEAKFSQLTGKYFNELYFRQSKSRFDSVVVQLNESFPKSEDLVFETHKNLNISMLQTEAFRIEPEKSAEILSDIPEEFWNYPAFTAFFEKTFTNRLSFDAREIKGEDLKKAVVQNNVSLLLGHVSKTYHVNGKMAELALLKMLHDGFYSGDFSKNSIQKILTSEKLKNSSNQSIREITATLNAKLSFLQPGSKAPVICLKDLNGISKCSDENSGKFKYIIFADNEMMICQEHLKYLTRIDELFNKNLEIILVMRKTDLKEMKSFFTENKIPGIKLIDEPGEFIRKYKVKSFPSGFLLDEKHRVVFENVKLPLDGFEQQFGGFLQKELFERQRNQTR